MLSLAVWMVIGLVFLGVAVAAVLFIRPQTGSVDLGSVSEQWIAQHRAGPDPQP
jgi:hypothetical protein